MTGNEHGQDLVADEIVAHLWDLYQVGQQVGCRLHACRVAPGQRLPPVANEVVEVVVHLGQRPFVAGAGQVGPDDPQAGRDIFDRAQDRLPHALQIGAELHVQQSAHEDEQGDPAHLDQHVLHRAVGPPVQNAVGVRQHGGDMPDDLRLLQHRLHSAAQTIVHFAILDEHAVAQQLGHRIGRAAPAEAVALADHDASVMLRPNQHGGLEARQRDLEGRANLVAHDFQRRQQRALAGQPAQDFQAGLRTGDGKRFCGRHYERLRLATSASSREVCDALRVAAISSSTMIEDDSTPGRPAPGWVPAPTK